MFTKNDFHHPDEALQKINDAKMMIGVRKEIEAIKHILIKKGVMTQNDLDACVNYLQTTPEFKKLDEAMRFFEGKFSEYQRDPSKHLQDIFQAKMDAARRGMPRE